MYAVDGQDVLVMIPETPQMDTGAPLPSVKATEATVILEYYTRDDFRAIITFNHVYAHMIGPPNDETLQVHPLAPVGLQPYAAYEVRNSSWLRELERSNQVRPRHKPEYFRNQKHYIFTFHDSTFECIAEGLTTNGQGQSNQHVADQLAEIAKRYIAWADNLSGSPDENVAVALRLLPELYLAALKLPDVYPDKPDEPQDPEHQARWQALVDRFRSLPVEGYKKVFSPLKTDPDDPVYSSLSDDLADIYLDLDRGLHFYADGEFAEAVFQWRFQFRHHWGRHLVGALAALHAYFIFDY